MKNQPRQIIMKANKTMLIAALAAGSLLVWSPALRADGTNTPPSTPPADAPPAGAPPAGQPPRAGFDRMAEQLNLTADQKPKVQAVLDGQRQKVRDLRGDASLTPEDRRTKMKAIHEDTTTQMKAILTPEQFDKWQKMSPVGMRDRRMGQPPGSTPPPTGTPPPAGTPPTAGTPPPADTPPPAAPPQQ
jgi:Spy/CpxP family protein refolding chaperone